MYIESFILFFLKITFRKKNKNKIYTLIYTNERLHTFSGVYSLNLNDEIKIEINKKDMEKNDIHLTSIDTISKIHARDLLKENKRKLENFQENIKHEHKDEVSLYVKKKKIKKKM